MSTLIGYWFRVPARSERFYFEFDNTLRELLARRQPVRPTQQAAFKGVDAVIRIVISNHYLFMISQYVPLSLHPTHL
jgi:hypothetical protein